MRFTWHFSMSQLSNNKRIPRYEFVGRKKKNSKNFFCADDSAAREASCAASVAEPRSELSALTRRKNPRRVIVVANF